MQERMTQKEPVARHQWLMPEESEIGRIKFQGQHKQIVQEIPSPK
jgi:hypothetical protein